MKLKLLAFFAPIFFLQSCQGPRLSVNYSYLDAGMKNHDTAGAAARIAYSDELSRRIMDHPEKVLDPDTYKTLKAAGLIVAKPRRIFMSDLVAAKRANKPLYEILGDTMMTASGPISKFNAPSMQIMLRPVDGALLGVLHKDANLHRGYFIEVGINFFKSQRFDTTAMPVISPIQTRVQTAGAYVQVLLTCKGKPGAGEKVFKKLVSVRKSLSTMEYIPTPHRPTILKEVVIQLTPEENALQLVSLKRRDTFHVDDSKEKALLCENFAKVASKIDGKTPMDIRELGEMNFSTVGLRRLVLLAKNP